MRTDGYEIVIMATPPKLKILRSAVPFYKKNLDAKKIFVVADSQIKKDLDKIDDIIFVDEDSLYPGMHLKTVSDLIQSISGEKRRPGWYLQQFLKLAWAFRCDDEAYIVIDADTIPLHRLSFQDIDGKYFFTKKIEYNPPYFDTIEKLFSGQVKRRGDFSFIAENMIFDRQYVKEMINDIEHNQELKGGTFWEKIIYAVGPDALSQSGFSEFETYGNYMLTYHPERMVMRRLRTQREAVYILGSDPSIEKLLWAAEDYDIISIEASDHRQTILTTLADSSFVRRYFRMKTLVDMRMRVRGIYRKMVGKKDFRYE